MQNYLFKIKYDGADFHGWQLQPNCITVQQSVKNAFDSVFNDDVCINGCSRTDTGVHAYEFCFNAKLETQLPPERIIGAVNFFLPTSAVVYSCEPVPADFHARFDCKGKEYIYKVLNTKYPDPFLKDRVYHIKYDIDAEMLDREAKSFIGEHDFSAFCASDSSVGNTVRTIYDFRVNRENDMIIFRVSGNGFLYNMVRIMVGTLLDINRGKLETACIPEIIKSRDRNKAGVTAPAQGLYLNKVYYGELI